MGVLETLMERVGDLQLGEAPHQATIIIVFKHIQYVQGGFFDCSALKMTKCQPLKEISELFLLKND